MKYHASCNLTKPSILFSFRQIFLHSPFLKQILSFIQLKDNDYIISIPHPKKKKKKRKKTWGIFINVVSTNKMHFIEGNIFHYIYNMAFRCLKYNSDISFTWFFKLGKEFRKYSFVGFSIRMCNKYINISTCEFATSVRSTCLSNYSILNTFCCISDLSIKKASSAHKSFGRNTSWICFQIS